MIDTTVWEFNHLDENTYNNLEGNTYDEKLKTFRFLEKQKREEESIAHFQNVCDLLHPSQDITLNINLDISNIDQPVAQTTKEEAIAEQGAQEAENNSEGNNHEKKLFNLFPAFQKHSKFLKEKGYYKIGIKNLVWVHGGNLLLAGYFGGIQDVPGNTRFMWAGIEKAFDKRNLAQIFSGYDTMGKGKTAKYDKYDKELRELIAGKIVF